VSQGPITQFVKSQFSEREADDAAEDLAKVSQLRSDLLSATQPLDQRKETLFKYARRLPRREETQRGRYSERHSGRQRVRPEGAGSERESPR
jgi:hypothetical protein